jgi:HK97 family phage major capsid protein
MNHLQNKLYAYESEADTLTKQPLDGTKRARLQFLLSAISTLKRELGVNNEPRTASSDPLEFRKKFFSDVAQRTYAPLSESGGNGQLVPSDTEMTLKNLMLADGPLFAGSPILTNFYKKVMQPEKIAVSDDLSGTGFVLTENLGAATSEAELTGVTGITIGSNSKNFSSGLLLASTNLVEDVASWSSMEQIILKAVGARLSRIQNSTNLAALKAALALNSSAAVAGGGSTITASNVYALVSAVGAAYRTSPSAAFVMSPAMQTSIGALTATGSGLREFPDVLDAQPSILDYPVYVIASGAATDLMFGDFSYLYTKSTPVEMRVLRERFVDAGYYGYILQERAQAVWSVATTSASPVKYITLP